MWRKAFFIAVAAVTAAGCGPARSGPGVEPVSPAVVAPSTTPTDLLTTDAPATPTAAPAITQAPATRPAPAPPPAPALPPTAAGNGTARGTTNSGAGSCGQDYYRNSDGVCVHRPASGPGAPAGATAKCNDGTYSYSTHRSGTCSHHGGVAVWY